MTRTASGLPVSLVPSGSYLISKGKPAVLQADLGTCVGVAVWDRTSRVGGLLHLLLPEPPGSDVPYEPATYATTGLPLFLERLVAEGAKKNHLEACVAGGALMGRVSQLDLNLDIGGRTADIVNTILAEEQIPIRQSELGGYFTCRLSLNLQTWETTIEPFGIATDSANATSSERLDLDHLEASINQVRPIPQIALKVLRMISEQEYRHADVAKEIMQDQVMSAKIIGFCNSVFIGLRTRVDSIERALFVVGEKWLLQVILTTALEEFLSQTDLGYSLCKGGLFQHACGTASVAKGLAQFTGRIAPDLAYTAGLLHDIGKAVLDQSMHTKRPLFYRSLQTDRGDLIEAEKELFGITHPEVGNWLANRWSIPESLTEVILHHHQPEAATIEPELTLLVHLADLIMSRFMVGYEVERLSTDALSSRLARLGLSAEQFPLLVDQLPRAINNAPWLAGQSSP